jgi:hypothetical protein
MVHRRTVIFVTEQANVAEGDQALPLHAPDWYCSLRATHESQEKSNSADAYCVVWKVEARIPSSHLVFVSPSAVLYSGHRTWRRVGAPSSRIQSRLVLRKPASGPACRCVLCLSVSAQEGGGFPPKRRLSFAGIRDVIFQEPEQRAEERFRACNPHEIVRQRNLKA